MGAASLGASPAPASPDAASSPADALFATAREARTLSSYARYTVYATVVTFRLGNRTVSSTWDTVEDMRRRLVHSHSLSREENAHPHVPHGIDVGVGAGPSGVMPAGQMPVKGQTLNPERADDPLGELSFAVDQDFGLALNLPSIGASPDMSEVSRTVSTLPHIGRTGTIAKIYDVTDLGDVDAAGIALHHVGLRPLRDPHRNRLRELWLDPKTSLPVRAIVAGVGNRAPLQDVNWRIEFNQNQGGTYIAREVALAPLESDDAKLYDVTITFAEVRPTNRLSPEEALGLSGDVGTTDP